MPFYDDGLLSSDSYFAFASAEGFAPPGSDTTWQPQPDTDTDMSQMPTSMSLPMFDTDSAMTDFTMVDDLTLRLPSDTISSDVLLSSDIDIWTPLDFSKHDPAQYSAWFPEVTGRTASSSSSSSLSGRVHSSSSTSPSPRIAPSLSRHSSSDQSQAQHCRSQQLHSETCLTIALRALTTLHMAQSTCLGANDINQIVQPARKMETVLSTNRDVVQCLRSILACPCAAKSLVQLQLLSICGNLTVWNSAMITAYLESEDESSDALNSSASPTSQRNSSARVQCQPITIGHHQIDGKLGRAIYAQVMTGELNAIEGLVDSLAQRFCEIPADQLMTLRGSPEGLPNSVHQNLTSSLRNRLHNARAQIFALA